MVNNSHGISEPSFLNFGNKGIAITEIFIVMDISYWARPVPKGQFQGSTRAGLKKLEQDEVA